MKHVTTARFKDFKDSLGLSLGYLDGGCHVGIADEQKGGDGWHRFLHTQVALVSQEPVLFAESIRFNLTFGIPGGSANITQDQVTHLLCHVSATCCLVVV
jgi:hypothetical protein